MRLVLAQHRNQCEKCRKGNHQCKAQTDIEQDCDRCGVHFTLQKQPDSRLRQCKGKAQADSGTDADQQISQIDAAAPVAGDELVAHGAAGMLVPDEKRSQNCIHNGRKNDIDEDRIIHHPDLAVLSGVDGVDHSHGGSEKHHQRRQ